MNPKDKAWTVAMVVLTAIAAGEGIAVLTSGKEWSMLGDWLKVGLQPFLQTSWMLLRMFYILVGPMLLGLVPLTVLQMYYTVRLIQTARNHTQLYNPQRAETLMESTEAIAPTLGFLGTCIGLMATMWNMNSQLSQSEMLDVLLHKSSSAFGSTVYGASLGIWAYLTLRWHKSISKVFSIVRKDLESTLEDTSPSTSSPPSSHRGKAGYERHQSRRIRNAAPGISGIHGPPAEKSVRPVVIWQQAGGAEATRAENPED